MVEEVKVICRVCGRTANAKEFVLDASFGMMACPMCVRDKKNKYKVDKEKKKKEEEEEIKKQEEQIVVKHEDIEVEQAYREKQEQLQREREKALKVKRLDENKVQYTCQKCKYEFVYKLDRRSPNNCPYCGKSVDKFIVE